MKTPANNPNRRFLPSLRRLREMGLNPVTLAFPPELEAKYEEHNFHKSLPQVRMAIILGLFLYCVFGILDAVLVPDMKATFWTMRYLVVSPALVAVFIFSYSPRYPRYLQATMSGLMMLGGLAIIAMIVIAPPPVNFSYYAGLILIFIWGYTFIRVKFIRATATAWFLVLCYEAAAIATGTPFITLVNNNFFFIGSNIIGMFACYSIEYYGRRDFFMGRLLAEEQEKVKEANRRLEERVLERTFELEKKTEQLQSEMAERERTEKEKRDLEERLARSEKMEAIGRLAGGVAHDLNNVLNAIVGYPDLIIMSLPEDSPVRTHVMTIQRSGLKAAAIVKDLLTLARRGVTVKEVANLTDLAGEYMKSPELEKLKVYHPGVRIHSELSRDLWHVEGSPFHLIKTIMNLVSNAAEALPPEGGDVSISTTNRSLRGHRRGYEATLPDGDYVLLEVSDNGMGISPEDLKKIFEPFYSKKVMGRSGTGLGMAVVWGSVQDHHGNIDVQSIVGKGTTFSIYLPRTTRDPVKDEAPVATTEFMGNGETILVVDDVEEQRGIARDLLQKLGYNVHTVASGEEAVDYLKTHDASLVILDMIMDPGLDGLDTYRQILDMKPGTKAILASGFSETERVQEALRLGVGEYILKPFTMRKIGAAIQAELGRDRRR